MDKKRGKASYLTKRAVVLDPEEKKKYTFMQQLTTVRNDKQVKRKRKQKERAEEHANKRAKLDEKFSAVRKEEKKAKFREKGKEEKRKVSRGAKRD